MYFKNSKKDEKEISNAEYQENVNGVLKSILSAGVKPIQGPPQKALIASANAPAGAPPALGAKPIQ